MKYKVNRDKSTENGWNAAPWNDSGRRTSELCKTIHFESDWYDHWCSEIKENPRLHRKQWEYAYILEALSERGCLKEGQKGLGFAVGTEPLPAVMARYGCEVLATDIDPQAGKTLGWDQGNQLCEGISSLNQRGICDAHIFEKKVSYRSVDMNTIPSDLHDYDFNWSSCSFEHLGSIEKGLDFLRAQLDTLRTGGWAVHTTEYNISSEHDTVSVDPNTVIFRKKDIERFVDWANGEGHYVEPLDFSLGNHPADFLVDLPPYSDAPHLRLLLHGYVVTSIGLIIRKGGNKRKKWWKKLAG